LSPEPHAFGMLHLSAPYPDQILRKSTSTNHLKQITRYAVNRDRQQFCCILTS
jgi:hypothetical protein